MKTAKTSVTQTSWRTWAIELILYSNLLIEMTVAQLHERIERDNWSVLPEGSKDTKRDAIRYTLEKEIKLGDRSKIKRKWVGNNGVEYGLTRLGEFFVSEFLINNPNITPEKSRE